MKRLSFIALFLPLYLAAAQKMVSVPRLRSTAKVTLVNDSKRDIVVTYKTNTSKSVILKPHQSYTLPNPAKELGNSLVVGNYEVSLDDKLPLVPDQHTVTLTITPGYIYGYYVTPTFTKETVPVKEATKQEEQKPQINAKSLENKLKQAVEDKYKKIASTIKQIMVLKKLDIARRAQ